MSSDESKVSKAPKEPKVPKVGGPHDLRIVSPLSPELDQLVYDIIGAAMTVHTALGPGLLERSYSDALRAEFEKRSFRYECEVPVSLTHAGQKLRRYRLDLVVEHQVIVELKTVAQLHPVHSSQMLTYLRLTGLPVGVILNFHEQHLRDGIRRHVLQVPKASAR